MGQAVAFRAYDVVCLSGILATPANNPTIKKYKKCQLYPNRIVAHPANTIKNAATHVLNALPP